MGLAVVLTVLMYIRVRGHNSILSLEFNEGRMHTCCTNILHSESYFPMMEAREHLLTNGSFRNCFLELFKIVFVHVFVYSIK
jgi:hypothetical protein